VEYSQRKPSRRETLEELLKILLPDGMSPLEKALVTSYFWQLVDDPKNKIDMKLNQIYKVLRTYYEADP
jgi:hypothetical protein